VFRAVIGAIETAPIVVADATSLFGGGFGPDLAERLDRMSVLQRLDAKNVTDEYLRSLAASPSSELQTRRAPRERLTSSSTDGASRPRSSRD
jgi:carbon-monoxide dehydrogenase medium subunit